MKRLLSGVAGVLAGLAFLMGPACEAQTATAPRAVTIVPAGPATVMPAATEIVGVSHHVVSGGVCATDGCADKVCVAVPTTVKHTKTIYCSKAIDYCLPGFGGFGGIGGGRGACDDACKVAGVRCTAPRTKHVLLIKSITEEHPAMKCEVQQPCAPARVQVGQLAPSAAPQAVIVVSAPTATSAPAATGTPTPVVGQKMPQGNPTPR
jgi:hypothetical protein